MKLSIFHWHCPHGMRSKKVFVTARCPSVCLSHSDKPAAAGLLLLAQQAEDIDRCVVGAQQ